LASGFIGAAGSPRTQASYLSSLTTYIGNLAFNKNICYVLSGNDFDFNLIDPSNPKLFAISNSYALQDTISPVIALLLKISSRHFTIKNKVPFAFILDEATTFRIHNFENMPSILREYKCSFTFITQSSSKIITQYGREALSSIESNFMNVFLGRTKDIVALDTYPKLFSKKEEKKDSFSRSTGSNSSSTSKSYRIDRVLRYENEDFTNLKEGEFIGTSNSDFGEFQQRFKMFKQPEELELPIVRNVDEAEIEANYIQIINVVKSLF
jgi:type IV secretory pathway TraG/TraD family ATPase VirD4